MLMNFLWQNTVSSVQYPVYNTLDNQDLLISKLDWFIDTLQVDMLNLHYEK